MPTRCGEPRPVDPRGAAGREVACRRRHECEDQSGTGERHRIQAADAEQKALEEARAGAGQSHADCDADAGKHEALTHDERQHASFVRAERDADADFPRTVADGVRSDAVDPDRGE
jgi:hypothetical protein